MGKGRWLDHTITFGGACSRLFFRDMPIWWWMRLFEEFDQVHRDDLVQSSGQRPIAAPATRQGHGSVNETMPAVGAWRSTEILDPTKT